MTPISDDMVERAIKMQGSILESAPPRAAMKMILTAALEGSVAVPAWQPIETAPKSGLVLIAGGVFTAENSMAGPCVFVGPTIASYDEWEKAWKGDNCGGHDEFYWHKPTHWQPLPAPPITRQDGKVE